jgi:hypothetical protein
MRDHEAHGGERDGASLLEDGSARLLEDGSVMLLEGDGETTTVDPVSLPTQPNADPGDTGPQSATKVTES